MKMPTDVKAAKALLEETRPRWERGDQVEVTEDHGRVWRGEALTVKPSLVTGWWVEVLDAEGMVWNCSADKVKGVR